jgi:putative aldouronate transport system permease protein
MTDMSSEEIVRRMEISSLTFNCAKVVVCTIPVLIIYPFLQKYFVTGLVMGAVKE